MQPIETKDPYYTFPFVKYEPKYMIISQKTGQVVESVYKEDNKLNYHQYSLNLNKECNQRDSQKWIIKSPNNKEYKQKCVIIQNISSGSLLNINYEGIYYSYHDTDLNLNGNLNEDNLYANVFKLVQLEHENLFAIYYYGMNGQQGNNYVLEVVQNYQDKEYELKMREKYTGIPEQKFIINQVQ